MFDEYSKKERGLFSALGYYNLLEHIDPIGLYKIAVEKAFIDNKQGPEIESLRRCAKALSVCKPYRMTPEFDDLISLVPEEEPYFRHRD